MLLPGCEIRSLKSEPGRRPLYHHKPIRAEGHLVHHRACRRPLYSPMEAAAVIASISRPAVHRRAARNVREIPSLIAWFRYA